MAAFGGRANSFDGLSSRLRRSASSDSRRRISSGVAGGCLGAELGQTGRQPPTGWRGQKSLHGSPAPLAPIGPVIFQMATAP